MGKVTWGTKAADIDNAEERESDFTPYEGDVPTPGVYRMKLVRALVDTFSTGNGGLTMLLEIAEPKSSPKSKFNGAPLWERLVDKDTQTFQIKQFMRAIGGTGRHWANTVSKKDDQDREVVVKWGNILADGLIIKAQVKRGSYQGEPRAEVARWLPKADEDEDTADDGTDSDDGAPF
jgi:hypothetical protein